MFHDKQSKQLADQFLEASESDANKLRIELVKRGKSIVYPLIDELIHKLIQWTLIEQTAEHPVGQMFTNMRASEIERVDSFLTASSYETEEVGLELCRLITQETVEIQLVSAMLLFNKKIYSEAELKTIEQKLIPPLLSQEFLKNSQSVILGLLVGTLAKVEQKYDEGDKWSSFLTTVAQGVPLNIFINQHVEVAIRWAVEARMEKIRSL